MAKRFFVFDFDGVVCDSTPECQTVSHQAWLEYHGRPNDTFAKDSQDASYFVRMRPYVKGAAEYYTLWRIIESGAIIGNSWEFEEECKSEQFEDARFCEIFYGIRKALRNEKPQDWLDLNPVVTPVAETIKALIEDNYAAIATLKDKASVRFILSSKGIHVPDDRILDRIDISSKLDALNYYSSRNRIPTDKMLFIDDNIHHLLPAAAAGYPCLLAAWTAAPADFLQIAADVGIAVEENPNNIASRCLS